MASGLEMEEWLLFYRVNMLGNNLSIDKGVECAAFILPYTADASFAVGNPAMMGTKETMDKFDFKFALTCLPHLFTDALGKFFMGCCYVNNVPPVFYLNNPLKRIISHCPFLFILYEIEDILFMLLKIIAFQCHKPLSIPVSYLLACRTEDGKCLFIALSPFIKAFIH